ncbi:hypothetical protein F5Y07DRAFT_85540 [Xylaria sp. FL0933]|nr:hypothetical protein F5Y07DRAFT_85540 [Xylaria sp. FL0933]
MSTPVLNSALTGAWSTTAKYANAAILSSVHLANDVGKKTADWAANSETVHRATDAGGKAADWAVANPGKAAAVGAGAVLVAAPMALAAPLLGAAGFGANGIVAGSLAAGAQSSIGSVVAPSLFATLQSAGAAGYGVAAVSGVVQAAGVAVAASVGASSALKKRGEEGGDDTATEGKAHKEEDEAGPSAKP